jgi:hypothetical protein
LAQGKSSKEIKNGNGTRPCEYAARNLEKRHEQGTKKLEYGSDLGQTLASVW